MSVEYRCDYCHLPIPSWGRDPETAEPGPLYCCYGCNLAARITHARGEAGHAVWMLTRLGIAVFLTMGVMVFSMYLYGQEIYAEDPSTASLPSTNLAAVMRYISLIFATPVFFILGFPILSNAVAQWRQRIVSTDALVVLGVAAAFLYSYASTLRDTGDTYYETACMVLVLITLGRYLEASGKLKASAAVEALEALMPVEVSIQRGDATLSVRPEEVHIDDQVLVCAGQRIPIDGIISSGRAQVDEQILTGESVPIPKQPGDPVHAGTINLDGALTVRASRVGADSTLGRLIALLESAKQTRSRYERLADRVAKVFVPTTIAVAIVGAVLGFQRAGWDEAIMSALTVMLIACPCALGIATPTAIWVSLGRAAAAGALFRDGEAVEVLARIRAFLFDKTGTLTSGTPMVSSFTASTAECADEDHALAMAAGLARMSNHAMSQGVVAYAADRGISPKTVSSVRTVPGRGLAGSSNDREICLGSVAMMREQPLSFCDATASASEHIAARGEGVVCIGWGGAVHGVFGLTETLRAEARQAVSVLRSLGCRLTVLTGDHERRGQAISDALGLETLAELTPEDKVRHVLRSREQRGPTAMVGDGLNDAPALAAADAGIAMGCGADVTRESAAVCLLSNDLAKLPWLVALARRTVRTIKINLFWAFAYNTVGMSLAVAGMLSPVIAAAAMVISSLLVVTHSLRLGHGAPETAS